MVRKQSANNLFGHESKHPYNFAHRPPTGNRAFREMAVFGRLTAIKNCKPSFHSVMSHTSFRPRDAAQALRRAW